MATPRASKFTLRVRREQRGWSQSHLGELSRLTRQTINAIEAGRSSPSVDVALRLAGALGCTVENLFAPESDSLMDAKLVGAASSERVSLARVDAGWVAVPLGENGLRISADGLIRKARGGRVQVQSLRPVSELEENVVVRGCAAALGLLADRLNAQRGKGRFLWFPAASGAALKELTSGHAHVAGVHLMDGATGEANVPAIRRMRTSGTLAVYTLARWELGLVTRPEDARRIRGTRDLGARRVRLVLREPDSGAQQLLERELKAAGIDRSGALHAGGHLEVARAIAMNAADAGVATRDAAITLGLRFLPLTEERYDLVLRKELTSDARITRLFDGLATREVRTELEALGYDLSAAGSHVADVGAG